MSIETEMAQQQFLERGGIAARAIAKMQESGQMDRRGMYQFKEYPKTLHISEGVQEITHETETIKGAIRSWVVDEEVFRDVIVHSEEEEERVLSGGKTREQVEEERQSLIAKCRLHGIVVDMNWSAVRLRRELGEKVDAPDPVDERSKLLAELETLRENQRLRQEIDRLKAEMAAPPDDVEDMRAQLTAIGISVDKRWGAPRLREELERATAPDTKIA